VSRSAAVWAFFVVMILFGGAQSDGQVSQVNVTTWHNDIGRTGQNISEPILNTNSFNSNGFGLLCRIVLSRLRSRTRYTHSR
jgi:hypothetical protein